ncbi:EamA family transporter, partial [Serratia marcescens]
MSAAKKSFISAVVPQIRLPEAVLIFITMIWGGTFLAVHH